MVAEWGPLFRRIVIQPGFFCSFLLQSKVPPTFLYIAAVSDSHSHQLLGHLHPNTSVPALYAHFLELWQSAQSIAGSLLRFCSQGGFFTVFFWHFFCSALCHPRACAAASASHSDQPLRTLHSTLSFLHYMLFFCSFCYLPSQSQHSNSLLKLCLEALFGAQSRVALPPRGCFQALLGGCTILPIISCSSFALFKYVQWPSTWMDQGAHREGCWFCICLAFPKNHGILALLHPEGVLCIICTVACPDAIKWVTSSSRNVVCTTTACSASAQPSAPVLLAFFTVLCFVPCFAGFAEECG